MHDLSYIQFLGTEIVPAQASPRRRAALRNASATGALLKRAAQEPDQQTSAVLNPFIERILQQARLHPHAYRPEALQRRLPACLRKLRVNSITEAQDLLEQKPELVQSAIDTLLIGVTEFFRDPGVFENLRSVVLPDLLNTTGGLQVYGAGVSDGHELYSMAILSAEAGALEKSELLGIDCRSEAIKRAETGRFHEEDMKSVRMNWREKYFLMEDGWWFVKPEIKARLKWKIGDVISFSAGRPANLILFRNLAIYLKQEHAIRAWENLYSRLAPDGYLVTGRADRPPMHLPFVQVGRSIYKKTQG